MHTVCQPAGANDELDKQMAVANVKCSEFFAMMKEKEKALLEPPYEFEVRWLCTTDAQPCAAVGHGSVTGSAK